MAKKELSLDELYEVLNDEKTYKILHLLKDGERSSMDMIAEVGVHYKSFNYIISRMYFLNMVTSRTTLRTRIYTLNKPGIQELIKKLEALSGSVSKAAAAFASYA